MFTGLTLTVGVAWLTFTGTPAVTCTTRLAYIGDEKVARPVYRHACGASAPGAESGLGAVGLHLHYLVVAEVGDEEVAGPVHRHATGFIKPGGDGGLYAAAVYLQAAADLSGITALRLEVIPDHRRPNRGPGHRQGSGDFVVKAIRLTATHGQSQKTPIELTRASSVYSKLTCGYNRPSATIDRDPNNHWSASPRLGRHQEAVCELARPIENARAQRLRAELDCGLENYRYEILGRFRLSITNRTFPLFGSARQVVKADEMQNGFTRLGAAHSLLGQ
jgi:hypothetical protein